MLFVGLAAGVLVYLAVFAWHARLLLAHPYPLDYGEGPLLAQVETLRSGVPVWKLYSNPAEPPYSVVNYPPLYPLLVAAFSQVAGNPLLDGRLLSLLAATGSVVAITLLATPPPVRRTLWRTVPFALLFFTIPIVSEWSLFLRVDVLGVCLGLWGLVALQRRMPLLAAVLFVLSLSTKPSLLAAPVAGVIWVGWAAWQEKARLRPLLLLCITMSLTGGLLFLLLQWASGGWFSLHVIAANANRWEYPLAQHFWVEQAQLRWPLLLAAALGVGVAGRAQHHTPPHDSRPIRLPVLYTLAALLTAVGVGKVGAYANYFLELYAGLMWIICLAAGSSRQPDSVPQLPAVHHLSAALLLASLAFYQPLWSKTTLYRAGLVEPNPPRLAFGRYALWDDVQREAAVLAARERLHHALAGEVRAAGGDIFTDMPGVAAEAGAVSRVQMFEHRQLLDQGLWDQRPLLRDLANGTIPLAVIDYMGNWMTPEMITILTHRYAHDGSPGMFDLYRPVDPGPRTPVNLSFGSALLLSGYHIQTEAETGTHIHTSAGETVIITLDWQRVPSSAPVGAPITVLLRLNDDVGHALVESRRPLLYGALPPADWPEGATVQHMQPVALPPGLPPRSYHLAVSVWDGDGKHELAPPQELVTVTITVAAENGRFFEETGYHVPGSLLPAWERAGGVQWAGLPLMPAVPFGWGRLQCFEYLCLEQRAGQVTRREVGAWLYLTETQRGDGCLGSEQREMTDQPCPRFHTFWQAQGGAAGAGAAISGEIERNGYLVQWTRTTRLERLPDSTSVGVGRLGEETLRLSPGVRYRWPGE